LYKIKYMIIPSSNFLKQFMETKGALSVAEGIALYNIAIEAPSGVWIELGTHRGKSSQTIALAMQKESELHLVEPEFSNDEWRNDVLDRVGALLPESGLYLHANYSTIVLPAIDKIAFCFVDSGSHQDGLPMEEALLLEDKIIQGGIIAWHDWGNQFREPKEASEYLVRTGKYEWIGIDWVRINEYCNEHDLESKNDSWHKYQEHKNPNFIGAVRRK